MVQQVRHALRLGLVSEGDQRPTDKEVVAGLAINPNTVVKAYPVLAHDGLVTARLCRASRSTSCRIVFSVRGRLGRRLG